jgi:hypothetical protein
LDNPRRSSLNAASPLSHARELTPNVSKDNVAATVTTSQQLHVYEASSHKAFRFIHASPSHSRRILALHVMSLMLLHRYHAFPHVPFVPTPCTHARPGCTSVSPPFIHRSHPFRAPTRSTTFPCGSPPGISMFTNHFSTSLRHYGWYYCTLLLKSRAFGAGMLPHRSQPAGIGGTFRLPHGFPVACEKKAVVSGQWGRSFLRPSV